MCGRYTLRQDPTLAKLWGFPDDPEGEWSDVNFNIAPRQMVLSFRRNDNGENYASGLRWGLIPAWQKHDEPKIQPINARIEKVAESGMFRNAFKAKRCVVPASGYYEWKGEKGAKQPFYIHPPDANYLWFAGLWERRGELETVTIITRPSEGAVAEVHDRMPACLTHPAGTDLWLSETDDPKDLLALLDEQSTTVAKTLTTYPVDKAVGNVRNNGPRLIEPLG